MNCLGMHGYCEPLDMIAQANIMTLALQTEAEEEKVFLFLCYYHHDVLNRRCMEVTLCSDLITW